MSTTPTPPAQGEQQPSSASAQPAPSAAPTAPPASPAGPQDAPGHGFERTMYAFRWPLVAIIPLVLMVPSFSNPDGGGWNAIFMLFLLCPIVVGVLVLAALSARSQARRGGVRRLAAPVAWAYAVLAALSAVWPLFMSDYTDSPERVASIAEDVGVPTGTADAISTVAFLAWAITGLVLLVVSVACRVVPDAAEEEALAAAAMRATEERRAQGR